METGILVTLFLLAIVFGASMLALVVYTLKRETRMAPHDRPSLDESDDDPHRPVDR